ncbi:MAG: WG repeat-containing protein [Holophagaceae bacterium]
MTNDWRDKYDDTKDFSSEGLARVRLDGKWGFVDEDGNEVTPLKYDSVGNLYEGFARVKLNGQWGFQWGFVDQQGKEVIEPKYDEVRPFSEGLAGVYIDDKWGFINTQGKEVIPPKYDDLGFFSKGFAAVKLNGQWGFVDQQDKEVIPCVYNWEDLPERKDIPALSLKIRKKYALDPEGLELIRPEFDWKAWYEQVNK